MKNISFRKLTLSILALIIIGVGLTGCLVPDITVTGTAKLIVSGNYYYDIKMDGKTYFADRSPGTFYLTDIPAGNHKFEAVDIDGPSFGYDSKTVYISTGTTTTINLNPTSSVSTGSLQVNIMDDFGYKYYVYLGTNSSGLYLGTTTGGSYYNTLTAHNISTGNQNIYVLSTDGFYDKAISTYVNPNMTNVLNIWVK